MRDRKKQESGSQGGTQKEVVARRQPDPNLTKWQLNGSDLLREARAKLQGKMPVYDSDNEELGYKTIGDQLLPDEVIDEIMNLMNNYVNRNTQLADFTEREIHHMMKNLKNDLLDYLTLVYRDYKDKDDAKIDVTFRKIQVAYSISNYIFAALTRAKYGGEKKFLQETESREVSFEPEQGEGGGLLKKIFPGG